MVYKLNTEERCQLHTLRDEMVVLERVKTMVNCTCRLMVNVSNPGEEALRKSLEAVLAVQALAVEHSQKNYLDKVKAVKKKRGVMEDIKFNFEEGTFSVV